MIFNIIKKIWHNIVVKGKYHLLSVLTVVVTIFYFVGIIKFYANYIGSIFTIIGLLIILILQSKDARDFADYKPNTIKNWLKSILDIKGRALYVKSHCKIETDASAQLTVSISEDETLEAKVNFVLREVYQINERLNKLNKHIDNTNDELNKKTANLIEHINNLSNSIQATISNHVVGAYDLNLLGIILALCGTLIQLKY